jgi:two-component system LytT family sensor kinase
VIELRRWRLWAASFATATFLAAFGAAQSYASRVMEDLPADWIRLLRSQALDWYGWALLTPAVVALAARWPALPERRVARFLTWVVLALGFTFAHTVIEVVGVRTFGWINTGMTFSAMVSARYTGTMAANLMVVAFVVLAHHAVAQRRETALRAIRESALRAELAQSQLEALRVQLQPHFLFNTLNSVSALMGESVPAARRVLTNLGDLLRHGLEHSASDEVRLSDELAFLERYLDVQRTRFRERLRVQVAVDPADLQAFVPSLLLQPLVENAVRYAIEPRASGGSVEIRIRRTGESLAISVRDDGPGLSLNRASAPRIGLGNTGARLRQLYGDRHRFEWRNRIEGGLEVTVELPFHTNLHDKPTA